MTGAEILTAVGLASTALIAWWGHRRGKESDENAAESGLAIEERMSRAEVQGRYESLLNTYQEDTKDFREHIKYLDGRLDACFKEREELRTVLTRMQRKYGENGPEEVKT